MSFNFTTSLVQMPKRTTYWKKIGGIHRLSEFKPHKPFRGYEVSSNLVVPIQLEKYMPWFILVSDDSGHDYVIPESKSEDWEAWLDEEDDLPDYATRVEGDFRFREWEG
jgi:hypothetical protein